MTDPSSDQCHHIFGYYVPVPEFVETVLPMFDFGRRPPVVAVDKWWNTFNSISVKYNIEAWMVDHCVDLVMGYKDNICENALKNHGFTDELLNQLNEMNAKQLVKLRLYCKEFLNFTQKYNIPVLIVSAGITQIISKILEKNNILNKNITILSNKMIFEQEKENINNDNNNKIYTMKTKKNDMNDDRAKFFKSDKNDDKVEQRDRRLLKSWDDIQITGINKSDTYSFLEKDGYFEDKLRGGGRPFAIFMGDGARDIDTMKNMSKIEEYISIGFVTKDFSNRISKYMNLYDVVIDESGLNIGNRWSSLEWCYLLLYHLIECKDEINIKTMEKNENELIETMRKIEPMEAEKHDITDMLLSKKSLYNLKLINNQQFVKNENENDSV